MSYAGNNWRMYEALTYPSFLGIYNCERSEAHRPKAPTRSAENLLLQLYMMDMVMNLTTLTTCISGSIKYRNVEYCHNVDKPQIFDGLEVMLFLES